MPQTARVAVVATTVASMDDKVPETLFEAVLIASSGDGIIYQAGAFRSEADAEAVLEIWRQEGRTEEMAVNIVQLYPSAMDWQADR